MFGLKLSATAVERTLRAVKKKKKKHVSLQILFIA